jgi:hypothetical protein
MAGRQVGRLCGGYIHSRSAVQFRLLIQGLSGCCKVMLRGETTGGSCMCKRLRRQMRTAMPISLMEGRVGS